MCELDYNDYENEKEYCMPSFWLSVLGDLL